MTYAKSIVSFFLCMIFAFFTCAQTDDQHHAEHKHKKEHGIYEIIITGLYAYNIAHEEGIPGTEVHFTYWYDHTYGGGLSYTARFEEEETLQDLALLASWNPTRWITINVGPNFALPNDHRDFKLGGYAETEINARLKEWFHIGPIIGTVISEETELSVGLHLGFEF